MTTRNALITYEGQPFGSGGAHALRKGDLRAVWAGVERFLEVGTDYVHPDEAHLILYEEPTLPAEFRRAVHQEFTSRFGPPIHHGPAVFGPNRGASLWSVPAGATAGVLDWMAVRQPFPPQPSDGPLVLAVKAGFRLRSAPGGSLLPFQGRQYYLDQEWSASEKLYLGTSQVEVRLGRKRTCRVFFSLPFEEADEEFRKYATFLHGHVPFRLSSRHWTRWHLIPAGTWYLSRKLPPSALPF